MGCGGGFETPLIDARRRPPRRYAVVGQWRIVLVGTAPITDPIPSVSIVFKTLASAAISFWKDWSHEIWVQPIGTNDLTHPATSAPVQVFSSKTVAGQIIGNRRSKIYAGPGCGTSDTMAPQNRVVFASRHAAERAGYRAAYNCP